jgi:DNA repair protein RadA/Sms
MARDKRSFICQSCGHRHSKWVGKCEGCQEWNTLVEETTSSIAPASLAVESGSAVKIQRLNTIEAQPARWATDMEELDRVCGGGLVPGSVLLIGGDPGIGKSTLLIQAMAQLSMHHPVLYVSGEESMEQIQRRAARLGLSQASVELISETNISNILATIELEKRHKVVVVDSIQTIFSDRIESAAGTVSQLRLCAHHLIHYAKKNHVVMIFVGHVTKEGTIAGPKVLEHMVDTVLYFEGERGHQYRILRAVKNRFGPCNEIGVFDMQEKGLVEVTNPSSLFMGSQETQIDGSAIYAGLEGTRPLLVEVQALVSPCPYGNPRRSVVGWDLARLNMLLAVIETRCGISFAQKDVYLNIAGGLKIIEPGLDLCAAASLLSALTETALPKGSVFCGEIGLSGEVRPVQSMDARLKEAAKLGFSSAYLPIKGSALLGLLPESMSVYDVNHVRGLLPLIADKISGGHKRRT